VSAPRNGPNRTWRRAAVSIGLVLLATVSPATQAQDAGTSSEDLGTDLYGYAGTATADGVRVVVFADDYLLTDRLVDVGVPTAQAVLDGTQAIGYAASPDPGDLVLSAPGIVAQATGVSGLVPDYPLVVRSDTSSPTAQLGADGLQLKADSSPLSSEARATIGGLPGDPAIGRIESHAVSKLDPKLNRMQVEAASTVDGFEAVGGLLRIGRVESHASARQDQGGEVVRSGGFEVQGISVLGLPVAVNQDGIDLAGNAVPVPIGETVQSLLDASGLGLRMLEPIETPNGIISGGLQITQEVNGLPNAAGPAVVTITLGRSAAFVTGPSDQPPPAADVSDQPPTDTGGGPLVDAPVGELPSFGSVDQPTSSGPVSTPAGSPPTAVPAQKIVAIETRGLGGVYLVLIAAAGLVGAAGSLFRRLAVRSPWT
jgi:hypothetical protein